MNLLLISNSTDPEKNPIPKGDYREEFGESRYLLWPYEFIKDFCAKHNVKRVLFIPYAGVNLAEDIPASFDVYEEKVSDVFAKFGVELYSIHKEARPIDAVIKAEAIAVGGGNTFYLVNELHRLGLMDAIRERALHGMPYMGWSAGSNIACPTMKTTNDMPIVEPESFDCLNLLHFQINPHYIDTVDETHGGETREQRIREFLAVNRNIKVVGLRERCLLHVDEGKLLFKHKTKDSHPEAYTLRVFEYGKDAVELSADEVERTQLS
ncbi:dipeptidase PepE [Bacteroidales bacterium OttesenSCG-928-K22]|nr:dipeptidase PepE [Bacteroidales bacterium OttesenSCG-928-K22]